MVYTVYLAIDSRQSAAMLKKDAEQMEERLDSWRKENGIPLDKQKIQGKNILLEGMRYSEQIQALTDCYSLLFWLKSKE